MKNTFKLTSLALALSALTSTAVNANETKQYILKQSDLSIFAPETSRFSRANIALDFGAEPAAETLSNDGSGTVVTMELTPEQVAMLKASGQYQYIEEDFEYVPFNATSAGEVSPYGLAEVQAPLLQDTNADLFKVCVIDSGYDLGHPDLPQNATGFTDLPGGLTWYQDGSGHGTHVAGTIVALKNGTGVVGVLPNDKVGIHNVRVFDNDGKQGLTSRIARAVDNCVENGAKVINMSLGGGSPSQYFQERLQAAYDKGVLLIAAAGNDGNATMSYPASYDTVVSVANIDENRVKNPSSQYNVQVEIAAPGTDVLSTVPRGTGVLAGVTAGGVFVEGSGMTNSVEGKVSAELSDCGQGLTACAATQSICLIERGGASFKDKAANCQAGGGVAAIVYNNASGSFSGTLGDGVHGVTIPVISLSQEQGNALKASVGSTVEVQLEAILDYAEKSGTSMASPHVAGVAALVWSQHPSCSNVDIRNALNATAIDLGAAGRDDEYGFGLVQAKAASDYITTNGCSGAQENQAPVAKFTANCSDLACSFDATSSTDVDGRIVSYDWNIGGFNTTGSKVSHAFSNAGTYQVSVTVTDDGGATHSVTQSVQVTDGVNQGGCSGLESWSASKVYVAGTRVSYEGREYRSNWWNRGANPAQNSNVGNDWKVWTNLGLCQ
ncbi:S8 family serine peptidase [Pseudoalteromonas luteoviolacea]|uniref:Serine protease n=1 Tax=Pseudoalteromonas luteoviolacea DSM 6061 TaxID=1365250 RepID=A0A161ZUJ1_9GAMM|nr:S8 family serine peptidase [Pseudoalteromonas luteoviolacea]KZN33184.1 serine protease [Pseudoalteromonas luteoviolacea DSM 6061]MBE0385893.1 serine protease [Pseudoalteromonas luteoviolacea DSM 6061]